MSATDAVGARGRVVAGLLEQQLPVVMATDANTVKFIRLVDGIATELYDRVGAKDDLLDVSVAPLPILRWLADAMSFPLPPDLDAEAQRAVMEEVGRQFARRGTRDSLRAVLSALARVPVDVVESGWVRADPQARTVPELSELPGTPPDAEADERAPIVRVVIRGRSAASRNDLTRAVERELPAGLAFELHATEPSDESAEGE